MTLRCGTCSADNHRSVTYYEPPHQAGQEQSLSG